MSVFEARFSGLAIWFRFGISPFRLLRTQLSRHRQQPPSCHPQIRQREQRDHMRRVLGQPAEAHLAQTELPLDYPERMLDLRPHARLGLLDLLERALLAPIRHRLDPAALGRDLPRQVLALDTLVRTGVARIRM